MITKITATCQKTWSFVSIGKCLFVGMKLLEVSYAHRYKCAKCTKCAKDRYHRLTLLQVASLESVYCNPAFDPY